MVWKLPPYCTRFSVSHQNSDLSSACNRLFGARFSAATVQLCRRLAFLGLGFLSATKTQVVCRLLVIAFLGPGFRPPRFNFVIDSPFWGQVFGRHGSTLSSSRLFGARFSATTVQLCHRLAFLGPGFRPPRFNFVIDSPCLFGARFSAATAQLCHRLAFLGPGFRPPRFNFVVDSPFWG
jgi:hypothetical protein